jgi:hypothetical protein
LERIAPCALLRRRLQLAPSALPFGYLQRRPLGCQQLLTNALGQVSSIVGFVERLRMSAWRPPAVPMSLACSGIPRARRHSALSRTRKVSSSTVLGIAITVPRARHASRTCCATVSLVQMTTSVSRAARTERALRARPNAAHQSRPGETSRLLRRRSSSGRARALGGPGWQADGNLVEPRIAVDADVLSHVAAFAKEDEAHDAMDRPVGPGQISVKVSVTGR